MGPHLFRLILLAGLAPPWAATATASEAAAAASTQDTGTTATPATATATATATGMAPSPADACAIPPRYGVEATAAAIVRVACEEHRLWLRPFIDRDGRLAALAMTEAERAPLDDGYTPAWQRVARYWRESGTLAAMTAAPGAQSCMPPHGERFRDNDCRAFLLDTPWSAAFVSWVMLRAGVPGFVASPRHMDYIIHAWRQPERSPFRYADPFAEKPAPGDLLCFLRAVDEGRGAGGLRAALSGNGPLPRQSHCEVVIAANPGGDRTLHLVSGNVFNTVVMRQLPLERDGRLQPAAVGPVAASGAARSAGDAGIHDAREDDAASGCGPGRADACDLNRRDWAVLLKLRPQAQLGAPGAHMPGAPQAPAAQAGQPPPVPATVTPGDPAADGG